MCILSSLKFLMHEKNSSSKQSDSCDEKKKFSTFSFDDEKTNMRELLFIEGS